MLPTSLPTAIFAEIHGSYPLNAPEKHRFKTLDKLDGRTLAAKYARELYRQIEADLGGNLTAAQSEMAQRAAVLGAYLMDAEVRYLSGEQPDVSLWLAASNNQRRLLETLGLERVAKEVDWHDYLARKARQVPSNE
jgi:hypothetical protein